MKHGLNDYRDSHSENRRMGNVAVTWFIGNQLDRNCEDFWFCSLDGVSFSFVFLILLLAVFSCPLSMATHGQWQIVYFVWKHSPLAGTWSLLVDVDYTAVTRPDNGLYTVAYIREAFLCPSAVQGSWSRLGCCSSSLVFWADSGKFCHFLQLFCLGGISLNRVQYL